MVKKIAIAFVALFVGLMGISLLFVEEEVKLDADGVYVNTKEIQKMREAQKRYYETHPQERGKPQ